MYSIDGELINPLQKWMLFKASFFLFDSTKDFENFRVPRKWKEQLLNSLYTLRGKGLITFSESVYTNFSHDLLLEEVHIQDPNIYAMVFWCLIFNCICGAPRFLTQFEAPFAAYRDLGKSSRWSSRPFRPEIDDQFSLWFLLQWHQNPMGFPLDFLMPLK